MHMYMYNTLELSYTLQSLQSNIRFGLTFTAGECKPKDTINS